MEIEPIFENATTLSNELTWLSLVIDTRMKLHFRADCEYRSVKDVPIPDLSNDGSNYAEWIKSRSMGFNERLILILGLCPNIKPEILDVFFVDKTDSGKKFTEFGGVKGLAHGGFIPTLETVSFLVAGDNLQTRFKLEKYFSGEHWFISEGIIRISSIDSNRNEPFFSSVFSISSDYLTTLTTGKVYDPEYSSNFPAQKITTKLNWEDLVLPPHVIDEINDIINWIKHENLLMADWGLQKRLKPGYRSLFHGPPGTGKTLTASLIGKRLGLEVYRIDLSKLVSKYIGETEKNLASVFDQAMNKNWILFFDEADSLFGRRTGGNTSNDRHSNQEISYLLQRIEDFPGTVILASNLKANIDDAFTRRFQSIIYFPIPEEYERLKLWKKVFETGTLPLDNTIDLNGIAREHQIAGGSIINVLRYAAIKAVNRKPEKVLQADIEMGIRKELKKEGKG